MTDFGFSYLFQVVPKSFLEMSVWIYTLCLNRSTRWLACSLFCRHVRLAGTAAAAPHWNLNISLHSFPIYFMSIYTKCTWMGNLFGDLDPDLHSRTTSKFPGHFFSILAKFRSNQCTYLDPRIPWYFLDKSTGQVL